MIEAPDGLIVYDTGDYAEEGEVYRKVIEEKISKKPIKAIIYSHSHYALGGGAMVDDPKSVLVLGPDDLRYFVYKPKHLAEPDYNKELYSETPWYTPAMFYFGLGWYDRDASTMFQLPPQEESRRLVELMGGRDKVLAASQSALDNKEYAWAAQLVNHLCLLDPQDAGARQVKIDALRKIGQLTTALIGRSFALNEARSLEGSEAIPRIVAPKPEMVAANPTTFVNYHRVRIDPRKAENTDKVLTFTFADKTVGLHVRRGVVEFVSDLNGYYRQPDIAMTLDGDAWARLYLNQSILGDEIKSGKVNVTQGDAAEAETILAMFDLLEPTPNLSIP